MMYGKVSDAQPWHLVFRYPGKNVWTDLVMIMIRTPVGYYNKEHAK